MTSTGLKRSTPPLAMDEPSAKRTFRRTLETVRNDIADHAALDKAVLLSFPQTEASDKPLDVKSAWPLLSLITSNPKGIFNTDYLSPRRGMFLLEKHPELLEMLNQALVAGKFQEIRNLKILRAAEAVGNQREAWYEPILSPSASMEATMKSWSRPYEGNVATVFHDYLASHNPQTYIPTLPIAQSSGTGKSRMIDELSKSHFVIPLNLREGRQGYPAPDEKVLYWFLRSGFTPQASDIRFSAFLTALFEKLLEVIKDPALMRTRILEAPVPAEAVDERDAQNYPESLASQFRLFMTTGQTFHSQGSLRVEFYADVITRADQLYKKQPQNPPQQKMPEGNPKDIDVSLEDVVTRVLEMMSPGFQAQNSYPPLLILAVDEFYTLLEPIESSGIRWNKYSSLQRALRALRKFPIWGVFLSTKSDFDQLAPTPRIDPSSRFIMGHILNVTPFSAVGFDQVAEKFREGMTLERVTSVEYRISLGRPLWSTRYSSGDQHVKSTLTLFAIQKLLCRTWTYVETSILSIEEQFAVMSHRLPLDFNTATYSGYYRRTVEKNQIAQVEKHMRVLLSVRDGFETIVTVAPSEPILSEAAATVMQQRYFSSCRALQSIFEWPGMSKGDRAGLVVCNIVIDTLDRLMFKNKMLISLIVKATSFFEALFAPGIYEEKIRDAMPSMLRNDSDNKSFVKTFENSYLYITHFIKVHDCSVLSIEHVMRLAVRGVAIVCADNQAEADLILPMVYKGTKLDKANMTVIICQTKNDHKYSTTPKGYLFSAMNPFTLGIFERNSEPLPVIRMVYALAASRPVVHVMMERRQRAFSPRNRKAKETVTTAQRKHAYTSFDIWCGQASSGTFGAIESTDDGIYKSLLTLSRDVSSVFKTGQACVKEATMSMSPGAMADRGYWKSFCGSDPGDAGWPGGGVDGSSESSGEEVW